VTNPLVERVLRLTEEIPDRTCIVLGDRRTTYGDLGRELRVIGEAVYPLISPGDRVAVLMENSHEYAAACYGIWVAGGALVGLNTALKANDLAHIIEHSGAGVLIADPRHRELGALLEKVGAGVRLLEWKPGTPFEGGPSGGDVSADDLPLPRPQDLGAIVYTSGTTGHPKGVMLSHGNIAANTDSICAYLDIRASDRALCILPFYYSYGASVLNTHLVSGASIVLENSMMYPHAVLERLQREKATSLAGVPSTFYLFLKRTDLSSFDLTSLRYVTQAGGGMDPERIAEFRRLVPSADFVVMYGQTEATARLSYLPPDELPRQMGSAGRPIPGVELTVRNEAGEILPPGEVGEVWARGDNVMMGYWKDPEETGQTLKDGWLLTGDLGYMSEEGFLFLKGRAREMIKSGAHRISPAEIEEIIRGLSGVEDVAVVGMDDEILGQVVKACVISSRAGDGLKKEILARCRQELPLFKIPKAIEFRSTFPRTGSGKIRKHLLVSSPTSD